MIGLGASARKIANAQSENKTKQNTQILTDFVFYFSR
jgi:hypothetical protein